jgi:hypothetical protein
MLYKLSLGTGVIFYYLGIIFSVFIIVMMIYQGYFISSLALFVIVIILIYNSKNMILFYNNYFIIEYAFSMKRKDKILYSEIVETKVDMFHTVGVQIEIKYKKSKVSIPLNYNSKNSFKKLLSLLRDKNVNVKKIRVERRYLQ